MDIFHVNESNRSYVYPILKIIVCIALIIIFINRNRIFHVDCKMINILIGILCVAATMVCILCIYISAYELFQAHENRTRGTALTNSIIGSSEHYNISEIIFMAESNDIIEIQIVSQNKAVEIGTSSDCKNGSSTFFDKLYYIDGTTFEAIEDFKAALLPYAVDGQILVVSIDGVSPK